MCFLAIYVKPWSFKDRNKRSGQKKYLTSTASWLTLLSYDWTFQAIVSVSQLGRIQYLEMYLSMSENHNGFLFICYFRSFIYQVIGETLHNNRQ